MVAVAVISKALFTLFKISAGLVWSVTIDLLNFIQRTSVDEIPPAPKAGDLDRITGGAT